MKLTDKILYPLLYFWLYLHALLPFRALYFLSDVLYIMVYHIIGYRKSVTRTNLKNAFPDKTEHERLQIEKRFYHNFCDYVVETIKLLHISDKEIQKRMIFEDLEVLLPEIKAGKSGFLFLGHYGNWEWVPSITLIYDKLTLGQIYKPLKTKAVDRIFLKLRGRFGSISIPKVDTFRDILKLKRQGTQYLIGFMADQTPSIQNVHYWTNFLNQDTPVFTGVERIVKKIDGYVAYLDVEKVKRGRYIGRIVMITTNPQEEKDMDITEKYIRLMEKTILHEPAYWLWTHKRWKIKRENWEKWQQMKKQ